MHRKATPTKFRKPSFINLTIYNDEDENEGDIISKVTGNLQEQKLPFFSSSGSKDDDEHERILLATRRASGAMR